MKYLLLISAFLLLTCCQSRKISSEFTKIEYEAGPCFGFCPVFKMTIDTNGNAVLEAERFNFSAGNTKDDFSGPREGTFTTVIKEKDYHELAELLRGLNAPSLKKYYGDREITDLPTSYLRLDYTDGTSVRIQDYGQHGTEKLAEVYRFFEGLKHNQAWKKKE